jgi:hypothetical protein
MRRGGDGGLEVGVTVRGSAGVIKSIAIGPNQVQDAFPEFNPGVQAASHLAANSKLTNAADVMRLRQTNHNI